MLANPSKRFLLGYRGFHVDIGPQLEVKHVANRLVTRANESCGSQAGQAQWLPALVSPCRANVGLTSSGSWLGPILSLNPCQESCVSRAGHIHPW